MLARRRPSLVMTAMVATAIVGCHGGASPPAARPMPPVGARGAWSYEATLASGATSIDVDATFARGTAEELTVTEGAEPFVDDVAVQEGASFRKVPPSPAGDLEASRGTSWFIPACRDGCRVHYRFALSDAARVLGDDAVVRRIGNGAFEATPPAWLLHPLELPERATFRLRVKTTAPDGFATGLTRADDGGYEARVEDIPYAPYSIMGRYRLRDVPVPEAPPMRGRASRLRMAVAPGELAVSDDELATWLARAATMVRDYYRMFPIDDPLVVVIPHGHRSIGYGRTMAGGGAAIMIDVGHAATTKDLESDWVAVHEMIHLAFPSMPRSSIWIEEGLATYLEPLVRARAGMMDAAEVWETFVGMMRNGLPEAGDQGLDRTHTWGRTYWGGALFCLVADVQIREATHGERSLDDAVRGILAAGGNDAVRWDTAHAFAVGDAATRTHVLQDLYAKMGLAPGSVDLDALFAKLGVAASSRGIVTDDDAPLARMRKEMTTR